MTEPEIAASDNPQFDHLISNMDSDEIPYKRKPLPDLTHPTTSTDV